MRDSVSLKARHRRALSLIFCSIPVLSGCSSDAAKTPDVLTEQVKEVSADTPVVNYTDMPFNRVLLPDTSKETILKKRLLLEECLGKSGYPAVGVPDRFGEERDPKSDPSSFYGSFLHVQTVNEAKQKGYGVVEDIIDPTNKVTAAKTPHTEFINSLDKSAVGVYEKIRKDCEKEIDTANLRTDQEFYSREVRSRIQYKYQTHDKIVGVYSEWSRCMRLAGYDGMRDPDVVKNKIKEKYFSLLRGKQPVPDAAFTEAYKKEIKDFEIQLALADIECQRTTIAPHLQELIDVQNKLLEELPPVLPEAQPVTTN
jgi:hypothetical protein